MIAFILLAAQQQLDQSLDPTLQAGMTLSGMTNGARGNADCDDFNRANGPMSGNWTQISGSQNIDNNNGLAPTSQGNAWMQSTSASCAASASKVEIKFFPNPAGTLKYVAAVTGVGGASNYYTKIQSQGSTLYTNIGFYVGFNGGGSGSYGGFFAITPVAEGRMIVRYDAGTDSTVLEIDEFDNGSIDYTYTAGFASTVGALGNTGHGLGTYGDQRYDNWELNDGCGGGGGFTLTRGGACPGATSLTTAGGTPGGPQAFLYGSAGSFTQTGSPCTGLTLPISAPTLAGILTGNGSGSASVSFNAPAGLCGLRVVVVNVATCAASNFITL